MLKLVLNKKEYRPFNIMIYTPHFPEVFMGSIYSIIITLGLIAFICWLNYRLLSRLFDSYRTQVVRYAYLIFSVITIAVIGYVWSMRSIFSAPDQGIYLCLFYGSLVWLLGQIILLVFQPFICVTHRL